MCSANLVALQERSRQVPDLVLAPSGEPVSGSGSKKQYRQPQPPHRLRSNLHQLHLPRLHR